MNLENNITQIYNQYSQQLYFTALRITGESFEAEEIMQDTILKYHTHPQKGDIQNLGSWLKSICIRKAIDKLREKHRTKEFLQEYREEAIPHKEPPVKYTVEEIKRALMLLPDNYRTILSLHLFEGYDYQEIEQITGTKESTLRSLYKRAKERLATIMIENKKS